MTKRMADNMQPKTGIYKHREWRGLKDTAFDYGQWCVLWGKLIKWPVSPSSYGYLLVRFSQE